MIAAAASIGHLRGCRPISFLLSASRNNKSALFFVSPVLTPYHLISYVPFSRAQEELDSGAGGEGGAAEEEHVGDAATDVFRRWGCTEADVSQILRRQPSLLRMDPSSLRSKLQILRDLGICGHDLVKIVTCRPRFLSRQIGRDLDCRLGFLRTLFRSDACLHRAILRNPSLLSYKIDEKMRPCVQLYESMGIDRYDLGRLLISRPTVIVRSSLDDEKLELIHRTHLSRDATIYKYVVSIVAVSRLETIRTKMENLEKFGFTSDEVTALFARTPNVLTLSVEKVQRNMTYIMGTMKLPASTVLHDPSLLYANLDTHLKPRYLLGLKLQEMGLEPQIKGSLLLKAMRMKEPRFLKAFILCHKDGVAESLMEFYTSVKGLRRLAESSRTAMHKGFPF